MKRILFILPQFEIGGADKFNLDLLTVLTARGYQFVICSTVSNKNPWLYLFESLAEEIYILPETTPLVDQPQVIADLVKTKQIEMILLVNSYLGHLLIPFLRAQFPDLTYLNYTHMEEAWWRNGGYARLTVNYQEFFDLNIVSTAYLKQWMIQQGGDPDRIDVCYTNIDPKLWNPADFDGPKLRQTFALPPQVPLLLYAGRIVEQKQPRLFAEVIRRLAQAEKLEFICLVAGDGADLPFLQEFAQQNHLQNHLRFLGAMPLEQMKELQALSDILFLPSKHEGLSLTLYEAMAMQTVPVSSDVGGQKELVIPECGYLIPRSENEADEYVTVLKCLIKSPHRRQEMATAGRERIIKHFRLEQMAARMIELLNKGQHLAKTSPRPLVNKNFGQELATFAAEHLQLELLAKQIWQANHNLVANEQGLRRRIDYLQGLIEEQNVQRLSSKELSQRLPIRKISKAVGYKIVYKVLPAHHRLWLKFRGQALWVEWHKLRHAAKKTKPHPKPTDTDALKVMMVYPEMGAPTRYRVMNQATQLALLGLEPTSYQVDDRQTLEAVSQTDLLYLYRVQVTPLTRRLVKLAKQHRIPIAFDTDDLIWDAQLEDFCYLRKYWSDQEVKIFLKGFRRHELIMSQVDYFVVSTPFLAQLAQTHFVKKTYVNKNSVSLELQTLSEPFYQARLAKGVPSVLAPVTLTYFSGWPRAHQEDFEVILEPLRQLLCDRPQVRLKIVGHLNLDHLFTGYENRVQLQDFVEWSKLPEVMSQSDINLAPIVTNPQRRSKSAVKFLEAALVGLPSVASNLEPYQDIRHGQTGFLATTREDWYNYLIKLIDSPGLRLKMSIAARQQVLSQDTVQVRASQFKQVINQIIEDYYHGKK